VARIWLFLVTAAMFGCSSAQIKSKNGIEAMSEVGYRSLVNKNTSKTNQYSGFYQTFQADMTIITSELQTEMLKQRAQFLQWDQKSYQAERDKMMQESAAYSKFFMRFFSPDSEYDDLNKDKTIWKVFLDYNGTRFEGKVRKLNDKYVELKNTYPHLDQFSSPYEVTFNVPMTTVETGASKVTLTSSLGSAEFKFPIGK
jgi:hypothetical protein